MNIKKLTFAAFFSFIFTLHLSALYREDALNSKILYGNSPWGGKAAKFDYKKAKSDSLMGLLNLFDKIKKDELMPDALLEKINARSEIQQQINDLNKKLRTLAAQHGEGESREAIGRELDLIRQEKEKQDTEIKIMLDDLKKDPKFARWNEDREKCLTLLLNSLSDEESNDPWGMLIAKALAGPSYNSALDDDAKIKSWTDGAFKGGTVLMVGALSEVVREKAKNTIDRSVGSLWDFFFDGLINFGRKVRNVLFHDSNEPFENQKLDGWQKMIMAAYDDIDNMLRNGLRDSTRSLDSVSRQFDDTGTEIQVKKEIDMWASLASGYAEQFAYFITLFEKRREYYDEDDIVVFYSNQICQMLQTTCKLLTNSKSLKDLDTKLESQRTIIPAIKKNLWNLFEQLKTEVKPKSYSIKDTVTSTASTYKPNSYNAYSGSNAYGYNNDGPTSFAGGF